MWTYWRLQPLAADAAAHLGLEQGTLPHEGVILRQPQHTQVNKLQPAKGAIKGRQLTHGADSLKLQAGRCLQLCCAAVVLRTSWCLQRLPLAWSGQEHDGCRPTLTVYTEPAGQA